MLLVSYFHEIFQLLQYQQKMNPQIQIQPRRSVNMLQANSLLLHTQPNPTGVRVPRSSQENEPPSLSSHSGVSERIRKVCQDFNIRTVFRSGPTLGNLLTKAKDHLPINKQSNVVYEVPCTCGKVYIGETKRRLGTRIKEHKDTCVKSLTDKSAIAEHAWTNDHPINWAETKILQ